jgi:CO dehydrogenase maturation factor
MKLAVSGKGGVGKTTVAALIIRHLAERGDKVLAVDADPDANLGQALGMEGWDRITPISKMRDLIAARTESRPGSYGTFFKLNPQVDDLPDALALAQGGVKLMVLGGVEKGGGGCICPESTMLKALVTNVLLYRGEHLVLDMEAGIEHLGRGTARAVDRLLVVVEPGRRSVDTAVHIRSLGADLVLKRIALVGNKVRGPQDEEFLRKALPDFEFLGFLPFDQEVIEADLAGASPYDRDSALKARVAAMVDLLLAGS